MRVIRAILGALAGYAIFAGTAVALGAMTGRNLHAPQPLQHPFASVDALER